jgi:hypothetical protein
MSASEHTLPKRPRVFISYSHDSTEHCARVLNFAQQLRRDGIDAELDQFHHEKMLHWPRWCEERLRPENSDFVLCVCTAEYKRRIEEETSAEVGKGVFWEGTLIYNQIYKEKANRRWLPVLFYKNPNDIPSILQGFTCFELDVLGVENLQSSYSKLYRILTGQNTNHMTGFGELQTLPSVQPGKRLTDFIELPHDRFVKRFSDVSQIDDINENVLAQLSEIGHRALDEFTIDDAIRSLFNTYSAGIHCWSTIKEPRTVIAFFILALITKTTCRQVLEMKIRNAKQLGKRAFVRKAGNAGGIYILSIISTTRHYDGLLMKHLQDEIALLLKGNSRIEYIFTRPINQHVAFLAAKYGFRAISQSPTPIYVMATSKFGLKGDLRYPHNGHGSIASRRIAPLRTELSSRKSSE